VSKDLRNWPLNSSSCLSLPYRNCPLSFLMTPLLSPWQAVSSLPLTRLPTWSPRSPRPACACACACTAPRTPRAPGKGPRGSGPARRRKRVGVGADGGVCSWHGARAWEVEKREGEGRVGPGEPAGGVRRARAGLPGLRRSLHQQRLLAPQGPPCPRYAPGMRPLRTCNPWCAPGIPWYVPGIPWYAPLVSPPLLFSSLPPCSSARSLPAPSTLPPSSPLPPPSPFPPPCDTFPWCAAVQPVHDTRRGSRPSTPRPALPLHQISSSLGPRRCTAPLLSLESIGLLPREGLPRTVPEAGGEAEGRVPVGVSQSSGRGEGDVSGRRMETVPGEAGASGGAQGVSQ